MDRDPPSVRTSRRRAPSGATTFRVAALVVTALFALVAAACSSEGEPEAAAVTPSTIRSSGALAYADTDDSGPFGPRPGTASGDAVGQIPSTGPLGDGSDLDAQVPDDLAPDADPGGFDDTDPDNTDDPDSPGNPDDSGPEDPDNTTVPVARLDGIELVFADGALAAIAPRSTIEEIGRTLGPLYSITEEPFIREGFGGGYSVSNGGEVLFWAIEENGRITTIMATNPRVGLDSGLRPTMPLIDAVALHGEPLLRLGPQLREFAAFGDGTGSGGETSDRVSVLVSIGRFGGPVGVYTGALEPGKETAEYQLADAMIKELWFDLR